MSYAPEGRDFTGYLSPYNIKDVKSWLCQLFRLPGRLARLRCALAGSILVSEIEELHGSSHRKPGGNPPLRRSVEAVQQRADESVDGAPRPALRPGPDLARSRARQVRRSI